MLMSSVFLLRAPWSLLCDFLTAVQVFYGTDSDDYVCYHGSEFFNRESSITPSSLPLCPLQDLMVLHISVYKIAKKSSPIGLFV